MKLSGPLLLAVGLAACHDERPVRPLSAWAAGVRVESSEPPAGARLVAEVEGVDGSGCGILGERGSLQNATTAIKEAAARKGATYVKLTQETRPYSGRDCVHQEYALRGLAYALGGEPAPAVAAVAPPATTARPAASTCTPPCSPGYACNAAGVCVAECNPACAPGQLCRADRVCVPAAP